MMQWLWLILLVSCSSVQALFEYDRAAYAAQHKKWQEAQDLLTPLVTRCPCDARVIYDSGVTAYNLGQYKQALAYFLNVLRLPRVLPELREKAFFNAGNTYVKLGALERAVGSYEKVLEMNAENEQAKHNLEAVKKMLEDKKNNKHKNDKNDQDSDDKQDQKNNDQEKSQSSDDSSGDDESDDNGDDDSDNQEKPGFEKNGGKKQRKQQGRNSKDKHADNEPQGPRNNQFDQNSHNKSDHDKRNQQADHIPSPKGQKDMQPTPQASSGNTTTDTQKAQEREGAMAELNDGKSPEERADKWLAHILQMREERDAQLNKRMLQKNVGKQLVGSDGQNCW